MTFEATQLYNIIINSSQCLQPQKSHQRSLAQLEDPQLILTHHLHLKDEHPAYLAPRIPLYPKACKELDLLEVHIQMLLYQPGQQ
jgi:hypothetical protein